LRELKPKVANSLYGGSIRKSPFAAAEGSPTPQLNLGARPVFSAPATANRHCYLNSFDIIEAIDNEQL
jgi:hypothetical protein